MSGIYIKGTEMPKDGNETIVRIQPDGTILDQYGHHLAITAIFVPPHGRLGDLGRIERTLHEWESVVWDRNALQMLRDCINLVKAAPTIIPASGGKEDE